MNQQSDERTIAVQQRWGARGMFILSMALAVDVLVRALLLKQEPHQYLDISLIWAATMLYVVIGVTASGVEPLGGRSRSWLALIILIVVVNAGMQALMGMLTSLAELVATVVSSLAGAFLSLIILRRVYGAWERRTLSDGLRKE